MTTSATIAYQLGLGLGRLVAWLRHRRGHEGKSRREAARVFGLSRETIAKMCRYSAPPGYVRSKEPKRPKLGPLVPVIEAILEADKG
jgi:hypothetical protein